MPHIIDMERWIEEKPNAHGLYPVLVWVNKDTFDGVKKGTVSFP